MFDIQYSSSIPTKPLRGIQFKYDRHIGHINTLRKHSNENRIDSHFKKYDILFDIASSKYKNIEICRCQSLFRAPIKEREFIIDQRSDRSMRIELTFRTPTTFQSRCLTSPSNEPSTSTCKLVTEFN